MISHEGKVLVVVPTYMRNMEDWHVTKRTLDSLSATVPAENTIMIVDDASPDRDALKCLHEFLPLMPQYWGNYFKQENEGFASSVNIGLRTAFDNKMHCLLVNADMEFPDPLWFHTMLATDGWVVGAKLLYPNNLIQHAGVYFSVVTRTFDHLHKFGPADLAAANFKRKCPVTAALQLIKYECLSQPGLELYDEDFKLGWEDVDYCLRVFYQGGYCIYNPRVVATHYESMFRGNRDDKIDDWTKISFSMLHEKHAGRSFGEYVPMLIGRDPMAGAIA